MEASKHMTFALLALLLSCSFFQGFVESRTALTIGVIAKGPTGNDNEKVRLFRFNPYWFVNGIRPFRFNRFFGFGPSIIPWKGNSSPKY